MNDDNVLPANVVNSLSSRSERTPNSDSIEKPPLEEKLKGLLCNGLNFGARAVDCCAMDSTAADCCELFVYELFGTV
ncbi:hypothetical protein Q3G72_015255 [Acer saccharum]|nr:hypothetical protein Q3G72_015255 [Acer saccharum]